VFALHKPMGPSAYQALCALRDETPALTGQKLGHTGRLDPLAEGLLVVLVGDENRDVVTLRGASKTYEIDVLFGVSTDSFDSLGLVTAASPCEVSEDALRAVIPRWTGAVSQRVAPFSQARVDGRSLIAWGHAGAVVERPAKDRVIDEITVREVTRTDLGTHARGAVYRAGLVRGPFRQPEIVARWGALMHRGDPLTLARLTVRCGAGTYMRSLAFDLGESLGVPAMAWGIQRTRVGAFSLDGARELTRPWRP
jgi:tRNA pseudouridine55 synthase